jgi:hypothetical protein
MHKHNFAAMTGAAFHHRSAIATVARTNGSQLLADTARPYAALISAPLFPLFALRRLRLIHVRPNNGGGRTMLDIIFIILGFGGILAMAAYAALCGRI